MENTEVKKIETVSKDLFISASTKLYNKIQEVDKKVLENNFLSTYTNKSTSIDKFSQALLNAQPHLRSKDVEQKIYELRNNKQNPYTLIDAMLEVLMPILNEAGISCMFNALHDPNKDKMMLEIILLHSSGQWISSLSGYNEDKKISENSKGDDRKGNAAGLSHAKRIYLNAMLGLI